MKSRNVREADLSSLEAEADRLNGLTRRLTHGERDLKTAVEAELKRRRKAAQKKKPVLASAE
jgi:hypothetical protein